MSDRYIPSIRGDDPLQTFQLQSALLRQRQPGAQKQFARALMQQGASTAPVNNWVEGLARALQGTVGGYLAGKDEREGKESERQMLADMVGQSSQKKAEESAQLAQAGVPGFQMPMPNPEPGVAYPQPTAPAGGGPEVVPQSMLQPAPQPAARPVNAEMIAALSGMAGQGNRTAAGALPGFQFQYQDTYQRERDARRDALDAQRLAQSNQESFGAPTELMGPDGKPVLVVVGNRGTIRPIQGGYQPAADPNAGKTGLVPVMGYDENNQLVALFPDGRGGFKKADTGGVALAPRSREINLGTEIVTVDQGGNVLSRRPVDIAGKQVQEAVGKQTGADITGGPAAIQTAEQTTQLVDSLLQHPALRMGTGGTSLLLNRIPGTPTYDFGQRVEQLQGRAFLQAFESLKGGGQITEVEGRKATQAIARLSTAQTETAFREALTELRDITSAAADRARAKLPQTGGQGGVPIPGSSGLSATPPPAPPPGFTVRQ